MGSVPQKLKRTGPLCYDQSSAAEEEEELQYPLRKSFTKVHRMQSVGKIPISDSDLVKETYKNLPKILEKCAQTDYLKLYAPTLTDQLILINSFSGIARSDPETLREKWVEKLEKLDFELLWLKWWPYFWDGDFLEESGKSVQKEQLSINFTYALRIMWDSTEISSEMCQKFTKNNGIKLLLEKLHSTFSEHSQIKSHPNKRYIVSGFLSIILNCLRHYPTVSKNEFRKRGGLAIVHKFSTVKFVNLKTKAVIIMAFSVREDEMHLLETSEGHIQYILSLLKKVIASKDGRYKTFSVEELLSALNKIAESDSNKLKVVQKGALPLYVKLIRKENSDSVVCEAARGLWSLAFPDENKERLMEEPECIKNLETLKSHTNRQISQAAEGALWLISLAIARFRKGFPKLPDPAKRLSASSEPSRSPTNSRQTGHIMLSYNWVYKPIVQKFKEALLNAGYHIWIDDDQMSGSLLQAMATAIENASLVIIFVSESYKESPSCRTEAEYIFRLKKPIVPIMNQSDYTPDGWLGALVGSQLHFVCTEIDEVDELLPKVAKEIEQKLCQNSTSKQSVSSLHSSEHSERKISVPDQLANKLPIFSEWSNSETKQWLRLSLQFSEELLAKFEGFDGQKLSALQKMYQKAPASFYDMLSGQFAMNLLDLLTLAEGLEKLK